MAEKPVSFQINDTLLASKLIEAITELPAGDPGEAKERVTSNANSSQRGPSCLPAPSEKSNSVKLVFSKNNIEIAANTPDVGEARESLAVAYKGREFSIAFNPEFLQAPLRALTNDEVYLDLIDEMSPGVIKIQSPFLYVLMPMRIS